MSAEAKVEAAVREEDLPDLARRVLTEFALDPYGIEEPAAPSVMASTTNAGIEESNQAIIHLLGRQLLVRTDPGGRLLANYQRLGLDEETRAELLQRAQPFDLLGPPHSPKGMETLHSMFLIESEPIYLALEVTSHVVFRNLQTRSNQGRRTTFLIPRKRHVSSERRRHYDEILAGWRDFIRRGPRSLRENVLVRRTRRRFPHLFTSASTPEYARLDLYAYGRTTRQGEMVRCPRNSSLYDLVYQEYRQALVQSLPLFTIWPWQWVKGVLGRSFLVIAAVGAVIVSVAAGGPSTVLGAVALGIVANAVYEFGKMRLWPQGELYQN